MRVIWNLGLSWFRKKCDSWTFCSYSIIFFPCHSSRINNFEQTPGFVWSHLLKWLRAFLESWVLSSFCLFLKIMYFYYPQMVRWQIVCVQEMVVRKCENALAEQPEWLQHVLGQQFLGAQTALRQSWEIIEIRWVGKSQSQSEILGPTTWEDLKYFGAALPPGSNEDFSEPVTNVFVLSSSRIILLFTLVGQL